MSLAAAAASKLSVVAAASKLSVPAGSPRLVGSVLGEETGAHKAMPKKGAAASRSLHIFEKVLRRTDLGLVKIGVVEGVLGQNERLKVV